MNIVEMRPEGATQEPPSAQEQKLARNAEERLRRLLQSEAAQQPFSAFLELHFCENNLETTEVVALPPSALRLLEVILKANAGGHAVTVMAAQSEMSPNQAADLLGVSRPFLIKLLDEGKIPFRRVGAHRRIKVEALRRFQNAEEERQLSVLAQLQAQAQELNMGY